MSDKDDNQRWLHKAHDGAIVASLGPVQVTPCKMIDGWVRGYVAQHGAVPDSCSEPFAVAIRQTCECIALSLKNH